MTPSVGGRCVVVGDVMMDVTARISSDIEYASDTPAVVSVQPGGSAATTAAWMAHIGRPVTFVGCVGADAFGHDVAARLRDLGVDTRLAVSPDRSTGTCVILVDARRERTMFPDTGANSDLDAASVAALALGPGDHVHLSGYVLLNPQARLAGLRILQDAHAAGATCSLDPASAGPLRSQRQTFLDILPLVDVLVANLDEATVLSGHPEPAAALADLGLLVPTVLLKRGGSGVLALSDGRTIEQPAPAVTVVDTTGAGDAFAAGFLSCWLRGVDLVEAIRAGQSLAGVAVGRVGAGPPGR